MRPTIIAGNWKMYKEVTETASFLQSLIGSLSFPHSNVGVIVCPPFTSLSVASAILKGTSVALGAQNMSPEDEGAFTGEVNAKMLKSVGCTHVIIGHSERRQYFGETDEGVNKKVKKALASGLIPIACVGETLSQRENGTTDQVVSTQVHALFAGLPAADAAKVIIAYEPVWAIGTGKTATPDQAQDVHKKIRDLVAQLYGAAVADGTVIQYGGSVKPENAAELLKQPDIDGALVGGACLKVESFLPIIKAGIR